MDSVSILVKTVLESELKMLDITTPELSATNDVSVKMWLEKRLKNLEKNMFNQENSARNQKALKKRMKLFGPQICRHSREGQMNSKKNFTI